MKKTIPIILAAIILIASFVAAFPVQAQMDVGTGGPLIVRFTGTFYPLDQKDVKGFTLRVYLRKKIMNFQVEDVKDIRNDASKMDIINALFPPHLVIEGPNALLDRLQKEEMSGKLASMEGYLYITNGFFSVQDTWMGKTKGK